MFIIFSMMAGKFLLGTEQRELVLQLLDCVIFMQLYSCVYFNYQWFAVPLTARLPTIDC